MPETLLVDELPGLAQELATLLEQKSETDLIPQLSRLPIIDRCRCGDDFCATIYTTTKLDREYGIRRCISLEPQSGYLILDLRDQRIVCIEVLFRNEIREKLLRLLP